MVKNNKLLLKDIDVLYEMLNKFNQTDKKILYNIATGKKSEGLQKSIYYYARMLKKIAKTAKNSSANT